MHLRRAALLFALVLGLTALATAVAPAPKSPDESVVAPPPRGAPVPPPTNLTLHAPPVGAPPRAKRVTRNARLLLQVVATEAGQVELPQLGQVAPADVGVPARFDLLDLAPGRYDVMFEPALQSPLRVGTIVSR